MLVLIKGKRRFLNKKRIFTDHPQLFEARYKFHNIWLKENESKLWDLIVKHIDKTVLCDVKGLKSRKCGIVFAVGKIQNEIEAEV